MSDKADKKETKERQVRDLLRRFSALKETRAKFEAQWQDAMWCVSPVIYDFHNEKPNEPYKIPNRITNRPTAFLNTCITGIAGYAVSPNIKWFKLGLQSNELADDTDTAIWLEKCEAVMRRTFERCGFYQKALQWIEQAAIFGQAPMLIEEMRAADSPLRYHVPEVYETFLDDNETGETEVVYRAYWTTIDNAVNYYGIKAMHEDIQRRYEEYENDKGAGDLFAKSHTMDLQLLHCTYMRRTGKPKATETVGNKKWASVIIDIKNKHIIKETGYDEFPYALFFWEKTGKPYGRSPTIKARNDIAIYQTSFQTLLEVAEKAANPPVVAPTGSENRIDFGVGGVSYLRMGEAEARALEVGANYPITVQIIDKLEQSVKEWYNVDFFLMLRQTQGIQNMTATAVAAMQGEQTALLSALVSNLYNGLSKIIQRTFNILAKKRMLPPMPFALQQTGGSMQVDFLGVLAQAQKAAYEYTGILDVLSVAGQFAQFGKIDPRFSKVINWINPEALFRKAIESRGAPQAILRTKEEYEEVMGAQDAADEAAQAAQNDALKQQAVLQNAQNLNQRVAPNSMLEGALKGIQF